MRGLRTSWYWLSFICSIGILPKWYIGDLGGGIASSPSWGPHAVRLPLGLLGLGLPPVARAMGSNSDGTDPPAQLSLVGALEVTGPRLVDPKELVG